MLRYAARAAQVMDRRWKPNHVELAPSCPRCASPNTKFCYYNNYSLSQPRYFCKACRRYWTKGGSLRNVPIGGGCRKTHRTRSSPDPCTPTPTSTPDPSKSGAGHWSTSAGSDPSVGQPVGCPSPPSEINLAMVFERFLKQNSELDPETCREVEWLPPAEANLDSLNNCVEGSLGPGGQQQDRVMMLGQLCEGVVREMATQELMDLGPNSEFGLPNLVLGGDSSAAHDPEIECASEDPNYGDCSLPNFAWQELELQLPSDDQLKMSTICDNWSAFDLSGL